jgi:hypothetical protein
MSRVRCVAWVLDRIAFGPPSHRANRPAHGAGAADVRVPALLSGLLLIVYAPLILRFDDDDFQSITGITPTDPVPRPLAAGANVSLPAVVRLCGFDCHRTCNELSAY